MSSNLQCPHCGWQYSPADYSTPGDDGRSFVSLVEKHADNRIGVSVFVEDAQAGR